MHFIRTLKAEKEYNLNGEMLYASDIIEAVKADIQNIIDENSLPVEIEDIELIGSYTRGENTSGSDLDVLVQYSGDLSDDSLFNILSEEPLELNGVKIDINPINSAKDSIEDFKERNKGFSKKKSENITRADPFIIDFYKPYNSNLDPNDNDRWSFIYSVYNIVIEGNKTDKQLQNKLNRIALDKWNNNKKLQTIYNQNKKNTIYLWVAKDPENENTRDANTLENIHGFIKGNKNL